MLENELRSAEKCKLITQIKALWIKEILIEIDAIFISEQSLAS